MNRKQSLYERLLEKRIAKLEKYILEYNIIEDEDFWTFDDHEFEVDDDTLFEVSDEDSDKNGGAYAEVFENVICDALKYKGVMPNNYPHVDAIVNTCFVTNKVKEKPSKYMTDKEEQAATIFANLYNSLSNTVLKDAKLTPLPGQQITTTKWSKLGLYDRYNGRVSGVPKTDIIGGKFHVSVKKKGGSQLMSGTICETLATINAALLNQANDIVVRLEELDSELTELEKRSNTNSTKYKKLAVQYEELDAKHEDMIASINHIVDTMDDIKEQGGSFKARIDGNTREARSEYNKMIAVKNGIELKKSKLEDQLEALKDAQDDVHTAVGQMELARKRFEKDVINRITNKSTELHNAILREAITGEVKFGRNAKGSANYILVWDERGECEVFDVDQYIEHIQGHHKFDLSYKSNSVKIKGGKTGQYDADIALRITVNI